MDMNVALLEKFPTLTLKNILKYLMEGVAVAFTAYYINRKAPMNETLLIGITAAVTFMTLDILAPSLSAYARYGSGFGIGRMQIGGSDDDELAAENEVADGAEVVDNLPALEEQKQNVVQESNKVAEQLKKNKDTNIIVDSSVPYRLIKTQYGALSLISGYNENVDGYNKECVEKQLSAL